MKRSIYLTLLGVLAILTGVAVVWSYMPHTTAGVLLSLNNLSAGLAEKSIQTEFGEINYLEGGQGETIVMIHGIYARKEHWVDLARHLETDYHIIALDLPGFGENKILTDAHYELQNQQANLASVLNRLELDTFHIAANSMGAQVAASFVSEEPQQVLSFAFIGSPLGVPTPVESDMDRALAKGQIPLLVKTPADFHARTDWLFPNSIDVPTPIQQSWLLNEVSAAAANERIWHSVQQTAEKRNLLALAPSLSMNSLVIWCNEDRIFHVSGAEELSSALPNSQMAILDNCGHIPMLDKPDEVADVYLEFLSKTNSPEDLIYETSIDSPLRHGNESSR